MKRYKKNQTACRYPSTLLKLSEGPEKGENQTKENRPNTDLRLRQGERFCHRTDSFFNCSIP